MKLSIKHILIFIVVLVVTYGALYFFFDTEKRALNAFFDGDHKKARNLFEKLDSENKARLFLARLDALEGEYKKSLTGFKELRDEMDAVQAHFGVMMIAHLKRDITLREDEAGWVYDWHNRTYSQATYGLIAASFISGSAVASSISEKAEQYTDDHYDRLFKAILKGEVIVEDPVWDGSDTKGKKYFTDFQ
jgi:hypothetical protein